MRPTIFWATPTFFRGLYHEYRSAIEHALQEEGSDADVSQVEARIKAQWQQKHLLGSRCKLVIVGGAATSHGIVTMFVIHLTAYFNVYLYVSFIYIAITQHIRTA